MKTIGLKYLLKLFLLVQLVMFFAWFVGSSLLPFRTETFLGRGLGEDVDKPLIWSRANFDGFYYSKIARDGYQHLQQAFFPFYPRLIKFFQPFFKSFIFSGIFISSSFFLGSLVLFAQILVDEGENEQTVKKTLLLLCFFPTSFYFVSVYAESLLLFFVLLTFWLAKRKKWFWAGLTGAVASYTKLAGIFLLLSLLHEYYESESRRKMKERMLAAKERFRMIDFKYLVIFLKTRLRHIKNTVFISFSSFGLLFYMFYLKKTVGDPLYFIKVQPDFGAERTVNKLTMIYQVFWRYLKMVVTVVKTDPIYFTIWLELVVAILFLFLLILGWFKLKIRRSWLVFATLAYILPSLTGTFSSLPRYVLVCFPCFLVMAKIKLPKIFYALSFFLLLLCSTLFVRGYWIS